MKTIIPALSLFFILLASECIAQESDTTKYQYCELIGTHRAFTATKVSIVVDFGEEKNYWKDQRLKDEQTGKVKIFNSMIDALNYMTNYGWEFVQGYAIPNGAPSGGTVYRWLLKKRA